MAIKKTVLFLFLVMFSPTGFSSDYSNTSTEGRKDSWAWTKNAAASGLGNGIVLVVMFSTADRCKTAKFAILGNDEIDSIQLNIDGKKFSSMVTPDTSILSDGIGIVDYKLTRSALRELKNGSSLTVETNKGPLVTSLSGSALSFNMAYGNCMKAIPENAGGKIQQAPSIKNVQVQRPRSAYTQRLDEQYNLSRERMARQRAADLANRRAAYAKRKGLGALPGKHGLAREAKNEMAALGIDQKQRNLDRSFGRELFNDTSDLAKRGLMFEEAAERSDIARASLESEMLARKMNAETNALNAQINAARAVKSSEQNWATDLKNSNAMLAADRERLIGINERLAEASVVPDDERKDDRQLRESKKAGLKTQKVRIEDQMRSKIDMIRMLEMKQYGQAFTPQMAERPAPVDLGAIGNVSR